MLNLNIMKNYSCLIGIRNFLLGTFIIIGSLFLTSCLKDDTKKNESDENTKINIIKNRYSFKEQNAIGNGVYLQFHGARGSDTSIKALTGNTVIVTYTGENSTTKIIDATDSAVSAENDVNTNNIYLVYGPARIIVGQSVAGINLALTKMSEKDSAFILIPSNMGWGDYEPTLYKLKVLKIISNDSLYESGQMKLYADSLHITNYRSDSLGEIYSRIDIPSTDSIVKIGDSVYLDLRAYFVEAESFVKWPKGRIFFPRTHISSILSYIYGEPDYFPRSAALDSAVIHMRRGETREIIAGYQNVYGAQGFIHPLNYFIVPPYMPVHYIITLKALTSNLK
jgi:hypothetical protein